MSSGESEGATKECLNKEEDKEHLEELEKMNDNTRGAEGNPPVTASENERTVEKKLGKLCDEYERKISSDSDVEVNNLANKTTSDVSLESLVEAERRRSSEENNKLSASDALKGEGDRGSRSQNQSTLYLGNLHPFVNDVVLQGVFSGFNGITELKVIKDRATGMSAGYGFARFSSRDLAEIALHGVSGLTLFGQQVKVNWALQKDKEDELGSHHHVFVGDLSPEVTDGMLLEAFSLCEGCSDARVMWDYATGRSKGYGFVSFVTKEQAQIAIESMDGAHVGSRCIRCGWAQHKTESALPADPNILDQSDPTNTNVYVGNLPGNVSDVEAKTLFSQYGVIVEMKLHRKGNFGFVRYKTHEEAVNAIVGLNSTTTLGGRKLKCSWGRHPKVPPSGVKAQLIMAAVSSTHAPIPHHGMQPHHQSPQGTMLFPPPQSTFPGGSRILQNRGMPQNTMFSNNPGQIDTRSMGSPSIIEGMSNMSLAYGSQHMPMPPGTQLMQPQVDPMASQLYSIPPQNIQDSSGVYRMPPHQQGSNYGGSGQLGNSYRFQN